MISITKDQLLYTYQWNAISPDDPRSTGHPDSVLLNRNEGHEVLAFLRSTSTNLAGAQKAERLIKEHLPGNVRSREHVLAWLIDNWERY